MQGMGIPPPLLSRQRTPAPCPAPTPHRWLYLGISLRFRMDDGIYRVTWSLASGKRDVCFRGSLRGKDFSPGRTSKPHGSWVTIKNVTILKFFHYCDLAYDPHKHRWWAEFGQWSNVCQSLVSTKQGNSRSVSSNWFSYAQA